MTWTSQCPWPIAVYLAAAFCLFSPAISMAQSLWERRDPQFENLYTDVKARRAGDSLVILINEKSDVENKDQRLLKKKGSASTDSSLSYGVTGDLGDAAGGLNYEQEGKQSRQFNGDTQYKSEREFADRFAVTVVDVLPNGNLLVSGSRQITLEGDTRILVLNGIVRNVDIRPDNSVSSRLVSNLVIRYEAIAGSEGYFINQGWLSKKINRLWPF